MWDTIIMEEFEEHRLQKYLHNVIENGSDQEINYALVNTGFYFGLEESRRL